METILTQYLTLRDFVILLNCEMPPDLTALNSLLQESFREMTRWEVYQSEVESGRLHWGMVHTEKFFKENAQMFEGRDSDFYLLRVSGEPLFEPF